MLETEREGWSINCLQCGYTKDVENPILAGISRAEETPEATLWSR